MSHSDTLSVDVSKNHGIGPAPLSGRESHTTDMALFQAKLQELSAMQRATTDLPYSDQFWTFIESVLSQCQEPTNFRDAGDATQVTPKGPDDIAALVQRIIALSPLNPIHPYRLAEAAGCDHDQVLTELMYATKIGMTQMKWAPECTRCGSAVIVADSLSDLPAHANCGGCQLPNSITSLDRVMVTFTFSPEILYILANNYACVPSEHSMSLNTCFLPMLATNSGSGFQYSFGCGDHPVGEEIPPGRYRVHCPVSMTDHYLVVEGEASEDDDAIEVDYMISEMVVTHPNAPRKTMIWPHGKVKLNIFPDTRSFFVLWMQGDIDEEQLLFLPEAERAIYTSGADVINHPSFKLFEDQIVPSSHPLELKHVTLVFTDIVGSTELYAHLGDGEALRLVQRYFEVLFNAFAARGRIVKTIGDAVMASFSSSEAAIEAVAEALDQLSKHCVNPATGKPLEMRVGIHSGATVAVSLNGVNDYFGQTVNIAARVQSAAGASQCFISHDLLKDSRASSAFQQVISSSNFTELAERDLDLKGVDGPLQASGFIHSTSTTQAS